MLCTPVQESSEHYNRMLSEHTREIQDLKAQLADSRRKLGTAVTGLGRDGFLEATELRVLLAEKESLIKVRHVTCTPAPDHSVLGAALLVKLSLRWCR